VIPIVEDLHGAVDLARTMEPVPDLVAAGVTDFRLNPNLPDSASAASDLLTAMAEAFRAAR
jgi:hypothetical protein